LWSKVDYERNAAEFIRDQYAEPALTRERGDRLDRTLARRTAKLSIALAAARAGGVDLDAVPAL
jgi:predicted HD phosphohydrolase